MQNTTKPWTTTASLFPLAGYWHDSSLQEPGVLPYSFLHCFQDHPYLDFIPILLSHADSASHQLAPPWSLTSSPAEHGFSHAVSAFRKVFSFFHSLNIFPSFLKQLPPTLIFQKSIYNNVLLSSALTHYAATLMLVFWTGKQIAVFGDISRTKEYPCSSKGPCNTTL